MAHRYFHWDPVHDSVVQESDAGDNTLVDYTREPSSYGPLISEHRGGEEYVHHYDALGSTTMLTDETGSVTDTFTYDAWGNQVARTGITDTPYRWVGRWGYQFDDITKSFYVRARVYQPSIAQWISVDPITAEEKYLAPYTYGVNGPTNKFDPSGMVIHVFAWEGTGGTGIPGTMGWGRINAAIDIVYKPIVQSYPDTEWHYDHQRMTQWSSLRVVANSIAKVARTPDPKCPCCFPRIILLGYSWGGWTAAGVVDRLSRFRPQPVLVDAVFTIDPASPRWWVHSRLDATSFDNFCEWENHYQTVDTESLNIAGIMGSIKGNVIDGATNFNQNGLYPPGGTGPNDPRYAHTTLPNQHDVISAFKRMMNRFQLVFGRRRTLCCEKEGACPVPYCGCTEDP